MDTAAMIYFCYLEIICHLKFIVIADDVKYMTRIIMDGNFSVFQNIKLGGWLLFW